MNFIPFFSIVVLMVFSRAVHGAENAGLHGRNKISKGDLKRAWEPLEKEVVLHNYQSLTRSKHSMEKYSG